MSSPIVFQGRLSFTSPAMLEQAKTILTEPKGSLFGMLGDKAFQRANCMLSFDIRMTVPASCFEDTSYALAKVQMLRDARGHVDVDFEGDEPERRMYVRKIEIESPPRATSAWWARARAEERRPARVIYLLPEQDDEQNESSPSFVLGPMPEQAFHRSDGYLRELEAMLNEAIANETDADRGEALRSALSWLQRRSDETFLLVEEHASIAGLGSAREYR
jgi:hypothetical protein